jgi:HAD superfamily hydrolase (TIGR01509 family)
VYGAGKCGLGLGAEGDIVPPRFIDQFDVLLLDMAGTFMFDVDRFSAADDFARTYRRLGGHTCSDDEVFHLLHTAFENMLSDAQNPDCYGCFPSVRYYLKTLPPSKDLPCGELQLLEQTFAAHEIGVIPDVCVEVLHQLRKTHRLGVVSDIWSRSTAFVREFERAGVRDLFEVILFSSDHGHLKPSPYPFMRAIEAFPVDRSRIVFVGDSLPRDIAGAKAVGLSTIWINAGSGTAGRGMPSPDLVIPDLQALVER